MLDHHSALGSCAGGLNNLVVTVTADEHVTEVIDRSAQKLRQTPAIDGGLASVAFELPCFTVAAGVVCDEHPFGAQVGRIGGVDSDALCRHLLDSFNAHHLAVVEFGVARIAHGVGLNFALEGEWAPG